MNSAWKIYLVSIGMAEPFLNRVEEIIDFYETIYPNSIKDMFISEYVDNDGNRQYENIWFFSDSRLMEAKKFLMEDDFDAARRVTLRYWNIKKTDYDFKRSSSKSRLTITYQTEDNIGGILKASGENCDHLKIIFMRYILELSESCPDKHSIDSPPPNFEETEKGGQ